MKGLLTLNDISISKIQTGIYNNDTFVADNTLTNNKTIALEAGILYRIDYEANNSFTSTTWDQIGG